MNNLKIHLLIETYKYVKTIDITGLFCCFNATLSFFFIKHNFLLLS